MAEERGCLVCPYSKDCPTGVKTHYGFTLIGTNSYQLCQAYQRVNGEDSRNVLIDIEKHLPVIHIHLSSSN